MADRDDPVARLYDTCASVAETTQPTAVHHAEQDVGAW